MNRDTFSKDHSHIKQSIGAQLTKLILDFFRRHPRIPRRYVLEPPTDYDDKSNQFQLHLVIYRKKKKKGEILPGDIRFRLHDITAPLAKIRSYGDMKKIDKCDFL